MDPEQNTAGGAGGAKQSSTWLIVGAVVILVIVAWFMLMRGENGPMPLDSQTPTDTVLEGSAGAGNDADTAALSAQGTSDEVADIEADLNATDLNALNEVDQI